MIFKNLIALFFSIQRSLFLITFSYIVLIMHFNVPLLSFLKFFLYLKNYRSHINWFYVLILMSLIVQLLFYLRKPYSMYIFDNLNKNNYSANFVELIINSLMSLVSSYWKYFEALHEKFFRNRFQQFFVNSDCNVYTSNLKIKPTNIVFSFYSNMKKNFYLITSPRTE